MNLQKIKHRPLHLMAFSKRDVRTQFGALCWRVEKGEVQVLLVTSRGTGRWIIPKGWPQRGQTAMNAAATEAWEEAGVKGKVSPICLGIYSYEKQRRRRVHPCVVTVFPIRVTREADRWPEHRQRKRRWVSVKKAVSMVAEPELRHLMMTFDPEVLTEVA